jgi:magnesium chelatase subunit I
MSKDEEYLYMELVLHGLAETDVLNKETMENSLSFRDVLADMFGDEDLNFN